jgi:hypothetical protein
MPRKLSKPSYSEEDEKLAGEIRWLIQSANRTLLEAQAHLSDIRNMHLRESLRLEIQEFEVI